MNRFHSTGVRSRRGQVLIIVLASLLGGSALIGAGVFATGKPIRAVIDRVEDVVRDKSRRREAVKILEKWDDDASDFLRSQKERRQKLLDVIQSHDATPKEFHARFEAMQTADQSIQKRLLDLRYALKDKLTRDEWTAVFGISER